MTIYLHRIRYISLHKLRYGKLIASAALQQVLGRIGCSPSLKTITVTVEICGGTKENQLT